MKNGLSTPEGVLVRIKHKILKGLGIDVINLKILIDRYVNKEIKTSSADRQKAKTNLYNSLTNNKLTIKTFFKFLRVINAVEVEFIVSVTTTNQIKTTVKEKIKLFNEGDEDE
jgi:hypothetical protein